MTDLMTKALFLSALLILLVGCGEEPVPDLPDVTRPVKTLQIEAPDTGGVRNFPARIDAADKAELAFRVARNMDRETLAEEEFEVSRSIMREVAGSGQAVVTTNAQSDPRFSEQDSEHIDRLTESVVNKILHPLMGHIREWSEDDDLGALRIDTIYEAFELTHFTENSD